MIYLIAVCSVIWAPSRKFSGCQSPTIFGTCGDPTSHDDLSISYLLCLGSHLLLITVLSACHNIYKSLLGPKLAQWPLVRNPWTCAPIILIEKLGIFTVIPADKGFASRILGIGTTEMIRYRILVFKQALSICGKFSGKKRIHTAGTLNLILNKEVWVKFVLWLQHFI